MKRILSMLLRRRAVRLARFLEPDLPAAGCILDIGSGTGHNAECLARLAPLEVIEADVVDFHLVGRGPVLFDGKDLPFPDAQFSASTLLFVLTYVAEPEALLKETRRVTCGPVMVLQSMYSGLAGHLFLRIWDFVTGRFAFQIIGMLGLITSRTSALHPVRYFSRERLEDLVDQSGFRVRAVRRLDVIAPCLTRELYVLEPAAQCP